MLSALSEYRLRIQDPVGRMQCPRGWLRTRENSLNLKDAELWLVWKGSGRMSTGQKTLVLFPGFCALMRPGGIYDAELDEDHSLGITFIHFDLAETKRPKRVVTREVCRAWPEFFHLEDVAFSDAVSRRIVRRFRQSPESAEVLLRGLLMEVLQSPEIGHESLDEIAASAHRQGILRLVDEIRNSASDISVAEMAASVHLSPSHFSRLFRKTVGRSPMQFLLDARLARARHLLRETDLSVGEIADQLGYRDLFFFSRQFMQKEGISPTQYRGRLRRLEGRLNRG